MMVVRGSMMHLNDMKIIISRKQLIMLLQTK